MSPSPMDLRKSAIDWAGSLDSPIVPTLVMEEFLVRVGPNDDPVRRADDIVKLVDRRHGNGGPGVAVVDLADRSLAATRATSRHLMGQIQNLLVDAGSVSREYFLEETLTRDGEIPLEKFGSAWTFKAPHMDRESALFAHVYGPMSGFEGGRVILIDALAFASAQRAGFDELFEWSDEPNLQKPVLRTEMLAEAVKGFGLVLNPSSNWIVVVNNSPEAGILHGATGVKITAAPFIRELHRMAIRPNRPVLPH